MGPSPAPVETIITAPPSPRRRSSSGAGIIAVGLALLILGGAAYWWFGMRGPSAEEARVEQLETAASFFEALTLESDADALLETLPGYVEDLGDEDVLLLIDQFNGWAGYWDVASQDTTPGVEVGYKYTQNPDTVSAEWEPATASMRLRLVDSDQKRGVVEITTAINGEATSEVVEIVVMRLEGRWVVAACRSADSDGFDYVFYDPEKDEDEILDGLRNAIAEDVAADEAPDESAAPQLTEEQLAGGSLPQLTDDQIEPGLPEGHPLLEESGQSGPMVPVSQTPYDFVWEYCDLVRAGRYAPAYGMLPYETQAYYGDADQFEQTMVSYGITGFWVDQQEGGSDTVTVRQTQTAQGMEFAYTWTFVRDENGDWRAAYREISD